MAVAACSFVGKSQAERQQVRSADDEVRGRWPRL